MSPSKTGSGNSWSQGRRFILAGGAVAALDWTVFVGLRTLMPVPLANLFAMLAGVVAGFALHGRYTFRRAQAWRSRAFVLYLGVFAFNFILGTAALMALVAWAVPAALAKCGSIGLVACSSFILMRLLVFRLGSP